MVLLKRLSRDAWRLFFLDYCWLSLGRDTAESILLDCQMADYDFTALVCFIVITYFSLCEAGPFRPVNKVTRETNVFNFVRLVVLRMVYGVASMMGFSDSIAEFANGALVPPGVEDDYSVFGDRNDEDEYSYYEYR